MDEGYGAPLQEHEYVTPHVLLRNLDAETQMRVKRDIASMMTEDKERRLKRLNESAPFVFSALLVLLLMLFAFVLVTI